jgi:hypothetical protein
MGWHSTTTLVFPERAELAEALERAAPVASAVATAEWVEAALAAQPAPGGAVARTAGRAEAAPEAHLAREDALHPTADWAETAPVA